MELEINLSFLENYASSFSHTVLSDFFDSHDQASGKDLLNITPVEQINLLVLKQIFETWQQETQRLESPYFNYNSEDVQQALQRFMNVLSKNITVSEDHLQPLIEQATINTVLLCMSPLDYFERSLLERAAGESVSYNAICTEHKYVRIHREMIAQIKSQMERQNLQELSIEQFITLLSDQLALEETSSSSKLTRELSQVLEVTATDFALEEAKTIIPTKPQEVKQERSIFDHLAQDFQNEIESVNQESSAPKLEPVTKEWSFEKPSEPEKKVFTLNDKLANKRKTSLAESHQNNSAGSLLEILSINQKFRFMNELFNGQREQLNASLSKLDNCKNKKDAIQLIEKELIPYHSWNPKDDTVLDFIHVIKSRF